MKTPVAFESFQNEHDAGRPQVVWTKLVADLETPVSAMLKLADGKPTASFWNRWPAALSGSVIRSSV